MEQLIDLARDVRFSLRLLWKDRGFALTFSLTLAVCIAANTSVFAIVHSVLLRPLAMPESDRVLLMHNSYPKAGVDQATNAVPDYFDRVRDVKAFEILTNAGFRTVVVEYQEHLVRGIREK